MTTRNKLKRWNGKKNLNSKGPQKPHPFIERSNKFHSNTRKIGSWIVFYCNAIAAQGTGAKIPPGSQFSTKQTTQIRKKTATLGLWGFSGDESADDPHDPGGFPPQWLPSPEIAPQNLIINDYYPLEHNNNNNYHNNNNNNYSKKTKKRKIPRNTRTKGKNTIVQQFLWKT